MVRNNLNNITNHLQGMSEQQARILLQREGERLEKIAKKLWQRYIAGYSPKMYVRTGDAEKAIKLGRVKKVGASHLGIELTWENDLVYHDSIFDKQEGTKGKWKQGHAVMLISDGWQSRKLEQRFGKIHRFTYFEGTGYLYRVYKEYMASAPAGVTLDIQWSGRYTK